MPPPALRFFAALACALLASAPRVLAATEHATPAPTPPIAAELGLPVQRHFSADDYNGYSQTPAIAHTAEGFTVIGTYGAVIVYDGHAFEKIPLAAAFVTALHRAADGQVWSGSDNDIGVLATDPLTHRFRFESRVGLLPVEARNFGRIRLIEHTRDGVFATSTRGVLRFHDGRAELIPFGSDARLFAVGGRLYLHHAQQGLFVFDGRTFIAVETGETLRDRILHLAPWSETHALAVISDVGCFTLEFATGRLTPLATPLNPLIKQIPLTQILRLRDGRYALLRLNSGLLLTDPALQGAQIIDQAAGLATSIIFGASTDAEDGLWLALGNGVTRLDLGPGLTVFDERTGIRPGGTLTIVRQDGVLYAGTSDGLLRLEPGDPLAGRIARFVPDTRVREKCPYLGGSSRGLLVGTDRSIELLEGNSHRTVAATNSGTMTIQRSEHAPDLHFISTDDGSFVLDLATGLNVRIPGLPAGVTLWNFSDKTDDTLWAGSSSAGLWRVTAGPNHDWARAQLEHFPLGQAGLPAGKNWTAAFSLFGRENFLSDAGTHRWDAATRTFPLDARFQADGGDHLRFFPVLADDLGRAWTSVWFGTLACSRPLGYFAAEPSGIFQWHDAPARWSAGVGRWGAQRMIVEPGPAKNQSVLWTKSLTSLARIELAALPAATPAAPWRPVLRQLQAADRAWSTTGATSLRLPFSNAPIVLRYAAPRFRPGANIRYETRLLGFRDAWSAPSSENETVFTNLIGGPFQFEVRARDGDGLLSETASLLFSVAPPWHRTPLAYALYAAALAAAIFLYIRLRLSRAEAERRRLENLVELRTRDLATARDAAESASRAKSAFLASMSHELRTPLNGVLGYAQLLQGDKRLAPDQQERLRIVHQSGEHLLHMINDVLDLAKIEAGKLTLRPAPFALVDLLLDISAAHAHAAAAKNLTFTTETAPDLPAWVEADAQKLRQILDNLLGNAIKFTAKGSVTLRVCRAGSPDPAAPSSESGLPSSDNSKPETQNPKPHGKLIEFSVSDTGPGISTADQQRLFQAFEQAPANHATTTGTGLGLAISRALVERFGGTLTLDSAPGRGSTFAFTLALPSVAPGLAATTAGRRIVGHDGTPRRALIVDDHAINRRLLGELLAPLGFDCADYASPADALARLARGAEPWPDVAILDLRMPELDGLELTRRLRQLPRGAELKILLTSASVIAFDPADATRAGCDDFLPKPFRTTDLLEKLGRLLALTWRESDSVPPFPIPSTAAGAPLPDSARAALRELLATGDLEAFTAELARQRAAHPASTATLDALATAAARFQLSHLRQLLG